MNKLKLYKIYICVCVVKIRSSRNHIIPGKLLGRVKLELTWGHF